MSNSFQLPDLGEGVHEAEILAISVSPGQSVKEGDVVFEIETDKAAVEIPSPFTGVVSDILVREGDMALVGDVLITFIDSAEQAQQVRPATPASIIAKQEVPSKLEPVSTPRAPVVPASPSTRRLARELGVDLHDITPTGAAGVVTKDDVTNYALSTEALQTEKHPTPSPPAAVDELAESKREEPEKTQSKEMRLDEDNWGPTERIPFRSIRRATAKRMVKSWSEIPHVNCQDSVDITELENFRQKHKNDIEAIGGRLTLTIFAMKAVATALKNFPKFNASLDLEKQEILLKHYFHLGLAVDTENGLMVPVIKDVDRKSIKELAIEVSDAITKVRTNSHTREQMQGGTFTITNVGGIGGHQFSAIINHPEVAILGLGQARMQPAVITNERGHQEIVPRLIAPIVLCFDHRVVDGADAIKFLRIIINALEDPDELLITMI